MNGICVKMNQSLKLLLEQIEFNKLAAMVGASCLTFNNNNNSINFRFKLCKIANNCKIEYDYEKDLYNMTFHKITKYGVLLVGEITGLYVNNLLPVFQEYTNLRTSLG